MLSRKYQHYSSHFSDMVKGLVDIGKTAKLANKIAYFFDKIIFAIDR